MLDEKRTRLAFCARSEAPLDRGDVVWCLDNFLTGREENVAHLEDRSRFRMLRADVIDGVPGFIRLDAVFNLACAASPVHYQADPEHTMRTCVVGTRNLLALANRPIALYGGGGQTRSCCYCDDLVGGLLALMDHDGVLGEPVNLGNPTEITVARLAEIILRMTGSRSHLAYRDLPVDDPKRRKPDVSVAKRVLGWEPRISLTAGLRRTITWFADGRSNLPSADKEYLSPMIAVQ